ncbi:hypothetical protein RUM43_011619 [Polyplax serrata]|uniref:4-coumarate--CoA ligase n=1 Tax=Polyplax serrata TaxID=468196 RepID=A0AAN8PUV2_POLSC
MMKIITFLKSNSVVESIKGFDHQKVRSRLMIIICGRKKRWFSSDKQSNIVDSPLGEVSIPEILFHDLIFKNWSLWEKKTAIVCGLTNRKYSYRKLKVNSKSLGSAFQNIFHLAKGDCVAIVLPNCPEYPILVLASSMTGVVPTMVNPLYTTGKKCIFSEQNNLKMIDINVQRYISSDEIQKQFADCSAKLIITDHINYSKCQDVCERLGRELPIIVLRTIRDAVLPEGGIDLMELFESKNTGDFQPAVINMDDVTILPYSSGTTGHPKGVILTHRTLVSNLVQISHPETLLYKPTTWFHQDTLLGILPMFHIYGLMIATFYALKEGCRLIVLPRFNPRLYVQNMASKRVNILYVVPPIIKLLSHKAVAKKYLSRLEFVINAAAPMNLPTAYKFLEKAPHVTLAQGYGMTEASPALAHTSNKRMQKLGAIGIPIASTKFKISSLETGEALPQGKEGELCAWGPQIMKGYLNRPEETQSTFDKDGWLKTGDIAYYDEDGDFFIVDRLKNLIKVKGFQVAPAELEEAILENPKIKDVAVIGIKHKEHGEVPRAFVVVKEGEKVTTEEVEQMISKRMSSYKHLKGGVRFIDDMPRNAAGKIVRKDLQDKD